MAVLVLKFQRSSIHLVHDARRLEDGQDLNDAMMDFFVKLGQALVPSAGEHLHTELPPVAYLGSLFYDQLRKAGVEDGRAGHANVANWAKRRLGKGGLFSDGVGALAVPINEMLRDEYGQDEGKHWWLALLLNPRGGSHVQSDHGISLLCLDSLARVEKVYDPPLRTFKNGNELKYPLEVYGFTRHGPVAVVTFQAQGDGSKGALPEPRNSQLFAMGQTFSNPYVNLVVNEPGDDGVQGIMQGSLEFDLGSAAGMVGEYGFEHGEQGMYQPMSQFRLQTPESTPFQKDVGRFLGGYLAQEWDTNQSDVQADSFDAIRAESNILRPDVPQQENANDCGYFILEQILLVLQLPAHLLRVLAQAPVSDISQLPWPSQEQIAHRKLQLKEGLGDLFFHAFQEKTDDVEVLFEKKPELRAQTYARLVDGRSFERVVEEWVASRPWLTEGADMKHSGSDIKRRRLSGGDD